MITIYYLYYRFYRLGKSISLTNSYYKGRAVLFFSLATAINILTIANVVKIEVLKNKYFSIGFGLLWFFFWLRIFTEPKRFKRIIKQFENETISHRIIGGIGVVFYSIISFLLFIKVMTG